MKMVRLLHWEYPLYCVITAFYIPILSGVVLIFTGLRIRATLQRRRSVQIRLHQNTTQTSNVASDQLTAARTVSRRCYAAGSRRTLKIITLASVAYFACWSPYSVTTLVQSFSCSLVQSFTSSFQPPPGVQFIIIIIIIILFAKITHT